MKNFIRYINLTVKIIGAYILDFFDVLKKADAGKITTTELVNRIYNFCEVYSGRVMYPYQGQFSKRIIRSVLENDGAELTALFSRQSGKCFAKDTEILMFDGSRKKVQDIKVGDYVMTPNSKGARVTALGRGREEMFEVRPKDFGYKSFVVNKSHILSLRDDKGTVRNISVEDYIRQPLKNYKGYRVSVDYPAKSVSIYPYFFGRFLTRHIRIPISYLRNCRQVRLRLLKGIVDSDLCRIFKKDFLGLSFKKELLAKDTLELLRSLGFKTSIEKIIVEKNGKQFRIFELKSFGDFSCILDKQEEKYNEGVSVSTFDFDLIPKGVDDYYGFTIDSDDRLFLLGDYTVTHNTETVAITVGGLMIILPQLANMPMFLNDRRLKMFRDGLWVGIFAPSQRQAQTTYGRMKSRMQCKEAQAVLNDPDFRLVFTTSNGQTVALSNGSFCTAISASDGSNIEGESFKFIILEECFVKGTPVLTDKGYKPIESVKAGDKVFSFNHGSKKVELKTVQRSFGQPIYNRKLVILKTETGRKIVCTDNHKIFVPKLGYVGADSLQVNNLVLSTESGGEGVLQEEKIVSIEYEDVEDIEVFDLTVEDNHNFFANGVLVHNCQDISNYKIRKAIHPMGAAYNATLCKIGTATTFKGDFYEAIQRNKQFIKDNPTAIRNHFEYDCDVVARFNPKYAKYLEREKRSLGENSDEYRMSYKLEWIISRGMFVDIQKVEKECGDEYLGRVPRDMQATHVVGIDVGGGSSSNKKYADSTVITVVEVNWNEPVLMEKTTDDETGEDIVYTAYNTYIKDWCEIRPEIAENYEEQYQMIMEYLKNFNVLRIVIDATRESSLAQRIQANMRCEVIPFVFSSKSKSDIYKHLQIEINTGRARFPRDRDTIVTSEYRKFTQQLADLQKGYSGSHLVVSHPDEKGAHDDYPDSWCLAVWGTRDQGYVDNTETLNRGEVLSVHKSTSVFGSKNRFTARRR